jgi:hypothetical protein
MVEQNGKSNNLGNFSQGVKREVPKCVPDFRLMPQYK